ncbi:hypothetical protein [Sphingomonas bacterium]|uniref:hypothetical protein n=1 Tax=Sphingomonas bacterium TaxID=1895847 RepID=UPI002622CE5B|nr:hypothetical protein [Sphingomonas bacterium]MDB5678478.1 hypothetical protein [Sphingomonas bacterium]
MQATQTIRVDPHRKLVAITLTGFFDVAGATQLAIDAKAAIDSLAGPRNQHLTLIDFSDCKTQSQDVVAAFQRALGNPLYAARRLAFITGSSLSRIQARRVLNRDTARWFDNRREAEAWLGDDRSAQSA